MTLAVETKNLTKRYGKFTALDGMNLSLEENKIYGLLGRNGAGKSTLLNLLTTQNIPTAGKMQIFGEDPWENSRVLQKICYIRENAIYPYHFRLRVILQIAADFFPNWSADFAADLIDAFELDLGKKVFQLSRGMKTALGVTIGLASRAPLTILDEPALGLDAVARQIVYDRLLQDYSEHPRTILMSTHLIDEVSTLFEQVVIMDKGKLILQDETELLRDKGFYLAGKKDLVLEFAKGKEMIDEQHLGGQSQVAIFNQLTAEETSKAVDMGIEVSVIPLQKLFVYLTEKEKRCNHHESH